MPRQIDVTQVHALRSIRIAHSLAPDPRQAVREIHAGLTQPDLALVMFFCSSQYALEALAEEMNRLFSGVQVVGCTTAGEIGPAGYCDCSISAVSFPAAGFVAVTGHIDQLQHFEMPDGHDFAANLLQRLEHAAPDVTQDNTFALLLIDGLSVREEPVARSLQNALGQIPLIGGSAGDGVSFRTTYVFSDGAFHGAGAVVVLVSTAVPFSIMKTQHFVPSDTRVVVTAADAHRVVTEIDGRSAAQSYALLLGIDVRELGPAIFADAPMVVVIDGENYVRSIRSANPDGSLTFYCAIEEGMVLRMARGADLVENLEQAFAQIHAAVGQPQLFIGFDCILRKLEIVRHGLETRVGDLFRANNAVGFNTYGEQFRGVHVNQTLTGIAIGSARTEGSNA